MSRSDIGATHKLLGPYNSTYMATLLFYLRGAEVDEERRGRRGMRNLDPLYLSPFSDVCVCVWVEPIRPKLDDRINKNHMAKYYYWHSA